MGMGMRLDHLLFSVVLLGFSLSSVAGVSPKAIERASPPYPADAFAKRMRADVKIKFDIDEKGRVIHPEIISVTPDDAKGMFESSVFYTLKKWRYESGNPAKNIVTTIKFRMQPPTEIR
ncbi:TonB family protein [Salmonella enterica subsp. enterica]|nr:TonB family protein [Salmonella enterica]EAW1478400.1 TonB family protein [Salmonella enterica subsp. enterica]EED9464748.1 TonB family protein [Salmonella enterica subsp. enterica serovar Abaetetuba]EBP8539827.1 TonB family protein [Salmonella enterica]EBR1116113.1 TonB family protein [Salmonella enterica]